MSVLKVDFSPIDCRPGVAILVSGKFDRVLSFVLESLPRGCIHFKAQSKRRDAKKLYHTRAKCIDLEIHEPRTRVSHPAFTLDGRSIPRMRRYN